MALTTLSYMNYVRKTNLGLKEECTRKKFLFSRWRWYEEENVDDFMKMSVRGKKQNLSHLFQRFT